MEMENRYDVVIVGSGLGGLECGVMLGKEGYNVCVLEQADVFGGCLQSFERKGRQIDTGIHYVGSMDEGQIMRQYFKYFGIFDSLDIVKLDQDFDSITLGKSGTFLYRNGYENFINELSKHFPTQKAGIEKYCNTIRSISESISVEVHKSGKLTTGNIDFLSVSAVEFIKECVSDPLLQNVLAGTNVLCGSTAQSANLYHHAMINHSNIEGAFRFVGGTQKIADLLIEQIRANGGTLLKKAKVVRFELENDKVNSVELEDGRKIYGSKFISNLHPSATFNMLDKTPKIKKAYKTRLSLLPNTYGMFSVYMCMKPGAFPYINKNLYYYKDSNVWDMMMTAEDLEVKSVLLSSQLPSKDDKFCDVITIMSPVDSKIFAPFSDSKFGARGTEYRELKKNIEQKIIEFTQKICPSLKDCAELVFSSTPLTYQHYTATPNGTAYGIEKSYENSLATLIPTRTKIENLHLTGQNLNVHGVIGVSLTAAATCGDIIGTEYLAKKIGNA